MSEGPAEVVSSAGPGRYHHGNLAEALLEAVTDLMADGGVEAVTLRAVARRAGVSHAAPTHHFRDKRGLLTAYATRGFYRFEAALRRAVDAVEAADSSVPTPEDRLLACGLAYVRFAVEERHYFDVMFRPELVDFGDEELHSAGDAAFDVLLELVADCRAGAAPDDPETRRQALAAWAFVHGLGHLLADGPLATTTDVEDPDELVQGLLPVLRDGMRAQPGWAADVAT